MVAPATPGRAMSKDAYGFVSTSGWFTVVEVEGRTTLTPCEGVVLRRTTAGRGHARRRSCAKWDAMDRLELPAKQKSAEPTEDDRAWAAASRKALDQWAAENDY